MHITQKTVIAAIVVLAAIAVAAPTSRASQAVVAIDERSGHACPEVYLGPPPLGGCPVHAVGTATLRVDIVFFELNEATCNLEAEMLFNTTASFALTGLEHSTGPDANCFWVMSECDLPWIGGGEEDWGNDHVVLYGANVCINPEESDVDCEGDLAFSLAEQAGEHYETQFNNATVGICELDVDLEFEHASWGTPIHINHP